MARQKGLTRNWKQHFAWCQQLAPPAGAHISLEYAHNSLTRWPHGFSLFEARLGYQPPSFSTQAEDLSALAVKDHVDWCKNSFMWKKTTHPSAPPLFLFYLDQLSRKCSAVFLSQSENFNNLTTQLSKYFTRVCLRERGKKTRQIKADLVTCSAQAARTGSKTRGVFPHSSVSQSKQDVFTAMTDWVFQFWFF